MFEHYDEPLISRIDFVWRMVRSTVLALVIVAGSLAIGTVAYRFTTGLDWFDALYNAGMLLTSMGPVSPVQTPAGKLFVMLYAFYAQLVFLVVAGLLLAPVIHRLVHHFHLSSPSQSVTPTNSKSQ